MLIIDLLIFIFAIELGLPVNILIFSEEYKKIKELLNFKEHGSFKKDTLDALRWAIDDIYAPRHGFDEDGMQYRGYSPFKGIDWETGESVFA